MSWFLLALSMPVRIDVQTDPLPALLLFALVCGLLWFFVAQARRRDERRRRADRDLSGWRSRQPPRS